MHQIAPARVQPRPSVVVGQDRFHLLETEVHTGESGPPQQKFVAEMTALMIQADPGRPGAGPPRHRNSDDEVGVDQIGGRRVQVELGEHAGEHPDLPAVAALAARVESEVLAESHRPDVGVGPFRPRAGRLPGGEKLRLLGVRDQGPEHVVGRKGRAVRPSLARLIPAIGLGLGLGLLRVDAPGRDDSQHQQGAHDGSGFHRRDEDLFPASTFRPYRCALRPPHYNTCCSRNLTTKSFFVNRSAPSPNRIVARLKSHPTKGMSERNE